MSDSNLVALDFTDKGAIVDNLRQLGIQRAHFTNGTYIMSADKIVPTVLAGFEYICKEFSEPDDALVIAVNSDISMAGIMDAKGASPEERAALESQIARAQKVALPLQLQHPDRDIVVLFYDEDTPNELYDHLAASGIIMETLHKWGYGTNPNDARIEGAHNFGTVVAYPLFNDEKPVCHDLTVRGNQTGNVTVVKLTERDGPLGEPYITSEGKLLFPLNDESLLKYAAPTHAGWPFGNPAPRM